MIAEQSYQLVPVSDLEQHPANPRRGAVASIQQSIGASGFYGAVIVQQSTKRILAGNHRWLAAKAEGLTEIPAIVVDVDDETATRILLADNRTADLATYDDQRLADLLTDLVDTEGAEGLTGSGYGLDDLDLLLNELEIEGNTGDTGPDLGGGGLQIGGSMLHLQWGQQRIPLADSDGALLDRLLSEYLETTGSQYGFLQHLLAGGHNGEV